MVEIDERLVRLGALREAERHEEALALLRLLFEEASTSTTPARRALFIVMLEWQFLAEVFAPARLALAELRDAQVERLLSGDLVFDPRAGDAAMPGYRRTTRFSLVIEMNGILGDARSTRDMFVRLEARDPELARRHAWQALPDIVAAGDFALADRYRGDPLAMLEPVNVNAVLPLWPPGRQAPRLAAEMMNLTRDVRIAIAVLRGRGRPAEADALRTALSAGLASPELRGLAERELDEPGTIQRMLVEHQMAQDDASRAP